MNSNKQIHTTQNLLAEVFPPRYRHIPDPPIAIATSVNSYFMQK